MNYQRIHDNIIERARTRLLTTKKGVQKHHIIPCCFCTDKNCNGYNNRDKKHTCGLDDSNNIVKLFAREHFIIHVLLLKIYKNKIFGDIYRKLVHSANMLSNFGQYKSRAFEQFKIEHADYARKYQKELSKLDKGLNGSESFRKSRETRKRLKINIYDVKHQQAAGIEAAKKNKQNKKALFDPEIRYLGVIASHMPEIEVFRQINKTGIYNPTSHQKSVETQRKSGQLLKFLLAGNSSESIAKKKATYAAKRAKKLLETHNPYV